MFSIPHLFEVNIKTDFFKMWEWGCFKNHKDGTKMSAVEVILLEAKRKQHGSCSLYYDTHVYDLSKATFINQRENECL